MLLGAYPVLGAMERFPEYRYDDGGPDPEVLGRRLKASRMTCAMVAKVEWRILCPRDPGDGPPRYLMEVVDALTDPFLEPGCLPIGFIWLQPPAWLPYGTDRFWRHGEDYIRAVAGRLNSKGVFHFIYGNEPNLLGRGDWADFYMRELRFAYRVLGELDPRNRVIAGNLSEKAHDAWELLYRLGIREVSDIIGYHPYTNDPSSGLSTDDVRKLHEIMVRHGDGEKKIFLAEGWGPKRNVPGVPRADPKVRPSGDEIHALRRFLVNGYRNLTTPHDGYDPRCVMGALFFTFNDNTGHRYWKDRAVAHRGPDGKVRHYTIDGYNVGSSLPGIVFYNGGLVTLDGRSKGRLLEAFPDGRIPGVATVVITADGAYRLWIDGREVGSRDHGRVRVNDVYLVDLDPGAHVIAIRAEDPTPPRGVIVDLRWNDVTVVTGDEGWVWADSAREGFTEAGFDDAGWSRSPGVLGGYHSPPWTEGYLGFVDSGAKWVWSGGSTLVLRRRFHLTE